MIKIIIYRFWKLFLAILILVTLGLVGYFLLSRPTELKGILYEYKPYPGVSSNDLLDDPEFTASYSKYDYHMPNSVVSDMNKEPNQYKLYYVAVELQNTTKHNLYGVYPELAKGYNDIWIDSTSICDTNLELNARKIYYSGLIAIVKTKGKSQEEINKLLKSIKIDIIYHNYSSEGFNILSFTHKTKTISFE